MRALHEVRAVMGLWILLGLAAVVLAAAGVAVLVDRWASPRVKIHNPSEPLAATVKWRGGTARFKVASAYSYRRPWEYRAQWCHEDGASVEYEPLSGALVEAAAKAYREHQRQSKADRLKAQERAAQAEFKARRQADRQKFRPQKLPRARVIPARQKDGN